jgi:hypothetical protein
MAYPKRRSTALEKAQARLRGLQSVHPEMELGNGLTLQDYAAQIERADNHLQAYNTALSESDRTRIELVETEAVLTQLSSRILSAVAATYGKDSKEYEMAGGKPPSSYKRSYKSAGAATPQAGSFVLEQPGVANGGSNGTTNGMSRNGAAIAPSPTTRLPH